MDKMINVKIKEVREQIMGKSVSIGLREGYVSMGRACVMPYEDGFNVCNQNSLMESDDDCISIGIRDIVEIDESDVQGDKVFYITNRRNQMYSVSIIGSAR